MAAPTVTAKTEAVTTFSDSYDCFARYAARFRALWDTLSGLAVLGHLSQRERQVAA